jgi:hypothetical protein
MSVIMDMKIPDSHYFPKISALVGDMEADLYKSKT